MRPGRIGRIIQDIAARLGRSPGFTFSGPKEIFRGTASSLRRRYCGLCRDHLREDRTKSRRLLALPIGKTIRARRASSKKARGTPSPRGMAASISPMVRLDSWLPPTRRPREDVDEEYPIILTTGRVVSQYLSGTQTRRIGPLVDQYPEPLIEMHPQLAEKLFIKDGEWARIEGRRGVCTLQVQIVTTIRPDTIFVPYHWAGAKSINQVTIAAQDPISKIPEFKVCAVRVLRQYGPPAYHGKLESQQ